MPSRSEGRSSGSERAVATVDVLVVGAGPVGLTLANVLGARGVSVLVVEEREALIDYPRGVGLDDESLRTFQGIGLVDEVQQHTIPHQILRFVNGKGQLLAEIAPSAGEYGWPRRNGFVQPLVDGELLAGLGRHESVEVRWLSRMESLAEDDRGVTATIVHDGVTADVRARFVVGCDGGRSLTRRLLGAGFDGVTSSTRWLVVDLANDPLGAPNSYVGADPERPYASISIAHGIRRFEFMIFENESDEAVDDLEFVRRLLSTHVPRPEDTDIIRYRLYTHHSRLADTFGRGRTFIAGDAAHLMPVWQGQGYNSGIRDAANLGWKLAAVIEGLATPSLLDTYDQERRGHARSMIDLSTTVGRFISVRSKPLAWLRDTVARRASVVPALKRYIVEMRFKPMPRYERGAVVPAGDAASPVGRLFIQPEVLTETGVQRLDDVLGDWFAVVCWNNDPLAILDKQSQETLRHLGARFVTVVPAAQVGRTRFPEEVAVVGDRGELKRWFDQRRESVVFLRPDHFVAAASIAQDASVSVERLQVALRLIDPRSAEREESGA